MALRLSPEIESKITELVASGEFDSADEVVGTAITLLDERRKLEHLREIVQAADERLARGVYVEESESFWDEINAEADELNRISTPLEPNSDVWP